MKNNKERYLLVLQNYQFGPWTFDAQNGTLHNGEITTNIEPQQANLLLLLMNSQGAVVTRDQIVSTIWQNIVVEDNTVSKAITRLRQLLNDNAKQPLYIKTVPKRGYQFIAPINIVEKSQPDIESTGKNKLFYLWVLVLITTITLAIGFYGSNVNPPTSTHVSLIGSPITYREGRDQNASFHPSEQRIIFNGKSNNRYFIFEKHVGEANARQVVEVNSSLVSPIWSNDGQHILFTQIDDKGYCQLYKVDIKSADSLPITQCVSNTPVSLSLLSTINAIFWQDDAGLWIFHIQEKRKEQFQINIDEASYIRLSPDGKLLVALHHHGEQTKITVYRRNGEVVTNKTLNHNIDSIIWNHNGTSLFYLGQHPAKEIFQMDLNNNVLAVATTSYGTIFRVDDINLQGQLLFTVSAMDIDIAHLYKGETSTLVNSAFADYNAAMSPNLSTLAFASKRSGNAQILIKKEQSITQISAFENSSYIYDIAWSPDSQRLLVKRNNHIYTYNLQDNTEQRLTLAADKGKNWQWVSIDKIAFIDITTNALFFYDISNDSVDLVKTNVSAAQLIDNHWYLSDKSKSQIIKHDSSFVEKEQITNKLDGRDWFIYQNDLYVFNKNPIRVSKVTASGEINILLGNHLNPLSFKATENFGFVLNLINNNEANIYMVELDK